MKFKIDRLYLLDVLKKVQKVIPSKTPLEALKMTKITMTTDGMTFLGSNANVSIEVTLPACNDENQIILFEDFQPGQLVEFLVDTIAMTPVLQKVKAKNIEFTLTGEPPHQQLTMKYGRSLSTFLVLSPNLYPNIEMNSPDHQNFLLSVEDFKRLVNGGGYTPSSYQENRPVLTGVHLLYQNGTLMCETTDTFALAKCSYDVGNLVDGDVALMPLSISVPAQHLFTMIGTIPKDFTTVRIRVNQRHFTIECLSESISLRMSSILLDGLYPDTMNFIPQTSSKQIYCDFETLNDALERLLIYTKSEKNTTPVIRLNVDPAHPTEITMTLKYDKVKCEEVVDVQSISGFDQPFIISFNPEFLSSGINALHDYGIHDLVIGFTSNMRPIVVRDKDERESILSLIVPVRMEG